MGKQGGPLILINASDLANGVRFSFVQEYFSQLCSDLSSFPVSRAVTASSAVPVLLKPVVVENYPECGEELPDCVQTTLGETYCAKSGQTVNDGSQPLSLWIDVNV